MIIVFDVIDESLDAKESFGIWPIKIGVPLGFPMNY
jgi:hypothetical protein